MNRSLAFLLISIGLAHGLSIERAARSFDDDEGPNNVEKVESRADPESKFMSFLRDPSGSFGMFARTSKTLTEQSSSSEEAEEVDLRADLPEVSEYLKQDMGPESSQSQMPMGGSLGGSSGSYGSEYGVHGCPGGNCYSHYFEHGGGHVASLGVENYPMFNPSLPMYPYRYGGYVAPQGPKGKKGEKGDRGKKGPKGPKGATGVAVVQPGEVPMAGITIANVITNVFLLATVIAVSVPALAIAGVNTGWGKPNPIDQAAVSLAQVQDQVQSVPAPAQVVTPQVVQQPFYDYSADFDYSGGDGGGDDGGDDYDSGDSRERRMAIVSRRSKPRRVRG